MESSARFKEHEIISQSLHSPAETRGRQAPSRLLSRCQSLRSSRFCTMRRSKCKSLTQNGQDQLIQSRIPRGASTPLYSAPYLSTRLLSNCTGYCKDVRDEATPRTLAKVLESVDRNDIVIAAVFQSFPKRQWRFDDFHGKAVDTCSTTSIRPILLHTIQPDLAI